MNEPRPCAGDAGKQSGRRVNDAATRALRPRISVTSSDGAPIARQLRKEWTGHVLVTSAGTSWVRCAREQAGASWRGGEAPAGARSDEPMRGSCSQRGRRKWPREARNRPRVRLLSSRAHSSTQNSCFVAMLRHSNYILVECSKTSARCSVPSSQVPSRRKTIKSN